MRPVDTCFLSISDASGLIARGEISPTELIDAHLERIYETDERLNSFVTVLEPQARSAAARAEAQIRSGNLAGPLHGIPIGLKDLYYTKGVRTTMGSSIMGDFVPDYDATVVSRFLDAGAIIIGKLQMHEFASGATSANIHHGPAHNPWDTERVSGGSSGGSGTSVAAGQVMAALGTDTGGSVRIPAALCGIVGLKSTFGRISRHGVYPLSWSFDTVGPMTRTVMDTALVMNAIAGHDPNDPYSSRQPMPDFTETLGQDIDGLRVGIPREHFFEILDPEGESAMMEGAKVLEGLGASVEEVSVPLLENILSIGQAISGPEAAEIHLENLRNHGGEMDPQVSSRLAAGLLEPAIYYVRAQRARRAFNRQLAAVFEGVDVLLTPSEPIPAPRIGQEVSTVRGKEHPTLQILARMTRPFNVSGSPAITVPSGLSTDGLPLGIQIAGRMFDDATVLRVAHAYEQATDWHTLRPPI
jgi:aspartyl-tRNA(Asn)/glutamyl-tRNA(Gln) amidotransferase subunit A